MLRIEMHKKAGIDLDALQDGNKKDRKKKSKVSSVESETGDGQTQQDAPVLLKEWNMIWALPLANALIHSTNVSRTQIASFCFPLITTFVGGKGNKMLASQAFAFLPNAHHSEFFHCLIFANLGSNCSNLPDNMDFGADNFQF